MNNKLRDIALAVVLILSVLGIWKAYHPGFLAKTATSIYSMNIIAASSTGDSYGLAFNGVQAFDMNGNVSSSANILTSGFVIVGGQITVAGIVNSSGTQIGGGTNFTKGYCASSSVTFGSMVKQATATVDFALTGATTSASQAYWVGIATSSAQHIYLSVLPTSTTGYVTISALNGTNVTWNGSKSNVTACYLQN